MKELNEEINQKQDHSIDELYILLGEEYIGKSAIDRDKESIKNQGKIAFDSYASLIKSKICNNEKIRKHLLEEGTNMTHLTIAIVDLIASSVIGISPVTIAVICTKMGVKSICTKY